MPDVSILSIRAAPAASRRILLASGVLLDMQCAFDKADGQSATRMAETLSSAPVQVFPQALFGAVSVPDVKLKDTLAMTALIGIVVGSVVFAVILAAVAGVITARRRHRRRLLNGAVVKPVGPKQSWFKNLFRKFKSPARVQQSINNTSPQAALEGIQTIRSASNGDELSLRELYACKQRMAQERGQSTSGSPPPALAGSPRPAVVSLKTSGSPTVRSSMVLFENPLAENESNPAAGGAAAGAPEQIPVDRKPRSNSPPPAVLAGWFKEARERSAEKKASHLSRRQSFRT